VADFFLQTCAPPLIRCWLFAVSIGQATFAVLLLMMGFSINYADVVRDVLAIGLLVMTPSWCQGNVRA